MELADAEELLAVYGDAETMEHLTSDLPSDIEAARDLVRGKVDLYAADDQLSLWTVIHRESGRIVGDVGLQHEDYGRGPQIGLGGRGNREFWHLGLGFEAAVATLDAGFTQLDLVAIGAETSPGNVLAQRVLGRLGMRRSGTNLRGWPVFRITREDWVRHSASGDGAEVL
jgi:RimJ/RimL family protein N-acetyltransferase